MSRNLIYLVDDTKSPNNTDINIFEEFKDILVFKRYLKENVNEFPEILEAKWLLIHANYFNEEGNFRFKKVRSYARNNNIQIIAFSGNEEKNTIDKKKLYENLYDFLQFYRKNKVINSNILIYGINSVFDKLIIKYDSIKKDLIQKDKREQFYLTKTMEERLKEFLTLLNYSQEKISKSINKLSQKSTYTNENFLDKLDNLLEKEIIRFNEISNNSK